MAFVRKDCHFFITSASNELVVISVVTLLESIVAILVLCERRQIVCAVFRIN